MTNNYTIYTSYLLTSLSGYSSAIHCNYINSVQFVADNPYINDINLFFSGGVNDFKFLSTDITTGTGFTANKIYMLIQLVSGTTAQPLASDWKIVDITSQISGFTGFISPLQLVTTKFKVSLLNYTGFTSYVLNNFIIGLNYPAFGSTNLCFGDEIYFLGNVSSDIHADVFVTDLSIILGQNQFNSSTNPTWLQTSPRPAVAITEIGIYDANKNLVAIGKLNDPLVKDSSISRTIVFDIDF